MQSTNISKVLFFAFMFLTTSVLKIDASCCNVMRGVTIGGYWDLDEKYYPKAVAYFEQLRQKYSALKYIPIILWDGPCADDDTIYFSIKWIEKLEKGNKFYLDATEWIILHEAGHIHHKDTLKEGLILWGIIGTLIFSQTKMIESSNHYNSNTVQQKCLLYSLAASTACISLVGLKFYLGATREYAADDFACKHCDNPQAWIAAYEFLDRFAPLGWLPGITHSFTKYRLNRISTAFQEKFGYELVVIPQSLDPEFVD